MVQEHTTAFFGRLIIDTMLVGRVVGCRSVGAQADYFVEVLTHSVGEIVAVKMAVDRMAPCFEMVDFGLCKWVELLLEKLTV